MHGRCCEVACLVQKERNKVSRTAVVAAAATGRLVKLYNTFSQCLLATLPAAPLCSITTPIFREKDGTINEFNMRNFIIIL